jgi:hypothetical protein
MKLLIIILCFICSSAFCNTGFDSFDDLVHIIKIKSDKRGSRTSSGTGFVVRKDGLILTNYHVISSLFKNGKVNKDKKAFVKIGKKEFLAELYRFDILHDLALLKVPIKFNSTVVISEKNITKGSKVFSLGYHDKEFLSINQGLFSDFIKDDENQLMALSIPINPGMSGGPVLNSALEVVGVNVLKNTDRESSAYGVNLNILKRFLGTASPSELELSLEARLKKQMGKSYGRIISSVGATKTTDSLNRWETPNMSHFLDCGEYNIKKNFNEDKDDADENQVHVKYKMCSMDYRKTPLSAMGQNIKINYAIANLTASKNTKELQFYEYLNNNFSFNKWIDIFDKSVYSCKKEYVKNGRDIAFKVSICAFKIDKVPSYIKGKNYFKYEVKAVSLTENMDDIYLRLQFSGEQKLAKVIIKSILNNTYRSEKDRSIAGQ